MDQILFPYGGYPSSPVAADVYPDQKSALEILLGQFEFSLEEIAENSRHHDEFFEGLVQHGAQVFRYYVAPPDARFHSDRVLSPLTELQSWNPNLLRGKHSAVSFHERRRAQQRARKSIYALVSVRLRALPSFAAPHWLAVGITGESSGFSNFHAFLENLLVFENFC
jgi:hypothetical protein